MMIETMNGVPRAQVVTTERLHLLAKGRALAERLRELEQPAGGGRARGGARLDGYPDGGLGVDRVQRHSIRDGV